MFDIFANYMVFLAVFGFGYLAGLYHAIDLNKLAIKSAPRASNVLGNTMEQLLQGLMRPGEPGGARRRGPGEAPPPSGSSPKS